MTENTTNQTDPAQQTGQATTPPATQQTSQTQQQTQAAEPPKPPTQEEIAALQAAAAKAAELESRLQQTERNYGELRADYTRKAQALAQLAGAQTPPQAPQDPLTPFVQKLVAKGYPEEDARSVAEMSYEMMQPILQQQQQYFGALQATQQVGDVMRSTWSTRPDLFTDPQVASLVEAQLRHDALSGAKLDPALAVRYAVLARDEIEQERMRNPNRPPPTQHQMQPSFGSFNGPTGGYTPAPPQTQPKANPQADALYQQMNSYSGVPKAS